ALKVAANAEAGHADMRARLHSHTSLLNALRTTQLEMRTELKHADHTLRNDMELQFEEVYRRFAVVDRRFDKIDKRFEQIDQRFVKIDERFDKSDARFESFQHECRATFARIDERFDSVREEFGIVHAGIARILQILEKREKEG
ncbi:hypothetical protein ACW9HQ_48895, partial [Nocardia gipuzkoensis]